MNARIPTLEVPRAAAYDAVHAVHAELCRLFVLGMQGEPVRLPRAEMRDGYLVGERTESFALSLMDALDKNVPHMLLRAVLKHSTCPHVEALRKVLPAAYADEFAEDLAEWRGQP